MKRWAIFTVIGIIVSACLVSSYAGININSAVPRPGILGSESSSRATGQSAPSVGPAYPTQTDLGTAPLDPNVVYAAIMAHPGLDKQLEQVGRGSRTEVAEWRRLQDSLVSSTAVDNRSRLGREVQKQVASELGLLRKIAEEEGAKKTVAAIDGVLLYRQHRLEMLNEQLQEDRRNARTTAGTTRSSRTGRTRTSRTSTGTDSGGRYAPSNRNGGQTSEEGTGITEEETSSGSTRRRR